MVTAIDYHLWASLSRTIYMAPPGRWPCLNVVAAAFFGSARWFDTVLQFNIQPSEIAKIAVILVLAEFFTRTENQEPMALDPAQPLWTMGIVVWIMLQPNLSTSIVMYGDLVCAAVGQRAERASTSLALPIAGVVFLAIAFPFW